MTERLPWWFSGGEEPVEPASEPSPEPASGPSPDSAIDWSSLATGAQRLVDWATDRVMAPHAEHRDPSAYPDCMVCRAMLLFRETGSAGAATAPDAGPSAPVRSRDIVWIPIIGEAESS